MKKLMVAAAAAIVLVSAEPGYAAPSHDQATGTGTLDQFGNPTAHVNAAATPSGVKGSFTITYPDGSSATGKPTCLSVTGNTAYVVGRVAESGGPRQTTNNWFPGKFLVIGVQDNGQPGTAGPDRLNFSPGFDADPGCQPNPAALPVFANVAGNYRVFDAP